MKPVVVLIRDGWGFREESELNGVVKGDTPYTDYLMENYPNTIIDAAGLAVGLPEGYQGNSEVGHMTIGAGRVLYQSLVRINKTIEDESFFSNETLLGAIENCRKNNSKLHVCGLLQQEGVHAHIDHCLAILDLCKKQKFHDVLIHVITDGRDAPVNNSVDNIGILEDKIRDLGFGKIATVSGRYFAMDRDNRWDRTKKAYDCIVGGFSDAPEFDDAVKLMTDCYLKEEFDEFIVPRKCEGYSGLKDDDSFIFFNFRSDRPRQLTKAIVEDEFEGWNRQSMNVFYVSMTDYYNPISDRVRVAFPPVSVDQNLGQVLASSGLKQLRISETEKYAHVTFFMNGQVEEPNENEDRILIPSPKVATYDLQPEMSVKKISDTIVSKLDEEQYDVIITNFVNGDMVGHTGEWDAVIKAVNAVDSSVKAVVDKVLEKDGTILILADHGNCEDMTSEFRTSHTTNPVPFILVSNDLKEVTLQKGKGLKDIAPTVLKLLGIEKPKVMIGESIY